MKGSIARFLFLGVCIVLAALLLFKILSFIAGALVFAAALIALGVLSKGFRKSNK
jgi:hypothetical protein